MDQKKIKKWVIEGDIKEITNHLNKNIGDIKVEDKEGNSLLHLAILKSKFTLNVVPVLLKYQADTQMPNKHRQSPKELIRQKFGPEDCKTLFQVIDRFEFFYEMKDFIINGKFMDIEEQLTKFQSRRRRLQYLEISDHKSRTLLHIAVGKKSVKDKTTKLQVISALVKLEYGVFDLLKLTDYKGRTVLDVALKKSPSCAVVEVLLSYGCRPPKNISFLEMLLRPSLFQLLVVYYNHHMLRKKIWRTDPNIKDYLESNDCGLDKIICGETIDDYVRRLDLSPSEEKHILNEIQDSKG